MEDVKREHQENISQIHVTYSQKLQLQNEDHLAKIIELENEKAKLESEFQAKTKQQQDQFGKDLQEQQTEMKEKLGRADQQLMSLQDEMEAIYR